MESVRVEGKIVDLRASAPAPQMLSTPKKRSKAEGRDSKTSSAYSEPRGPRRSRSTREVVSPASIESQEVPKTAPRKEGRAKKPLTSILGHQFLLSDDLTSHSVPTLSTPLESPDSAHSASYDPMTDTTPPLAPIPLRGLENASDSYKSGSSAPELGFPGFGPPEEFYTSYDIDLDSDSDRLTIQELKTRRDRFLRTVSLSPAIPASVQEDLNFLSAEEDAISSDDEEEFDDNDIRLEPRSKRAISQSDWKIPKSGRPILKSTGSRGYLEPRALSSPNPAARLPHSHAKDPTDASERPKDVNAVQSITLTSLRESGKLVKESAISKKGRRGGWQRRYLAVDDRRLYIFKSKNPSKPPKHIILLGFAQCKLSTEGAKLCTFDVFTPEKKYILATPSQTETESWVNQIKHVCEGSMLDNLEASATLKLNLSQGGTDARTYNKELLEIRTLSGNNVCADCSATSPDWAVINLGIFICIDCSGIHRSLGVQISKVRSLTLDRWERSHIDTMRQMGNTSANSIWEKHVPTYRTKPTSSASQEERKFWIHAKYVKRSFFDPSKIAEYPPVAQQTPPPLQEAMEALKPTLLQLLQTDKAFRKHVRSLLFEDS